MRADRTFCKRCLYELVGLARGTCPECGRPFDMACRQSFSRHPRWRTWRPRIAAGLLGMGVAYVASYYCIVRVSQGSLALGLQPVQTPTELVVTLALQPTYRVGGDLAAFIYAPMHAMDCRLRPERWSMRVRSTWSTGDTT